MRRTLDHFGLIALLSLLPACKATSEGGQFHDTGPSGGGASGAIGQGGSSEHGGQGGDIGFDGGPSGQGGSAGACASGAADQPGDDKDGDGWTVAQGDCNDCDKNVNPGAVEVIAAPEADGGVPTPVDEDCDGKIDNVAPPCDQGLDLADADPLHAARAVELCRVASGPKDWGVISAKWVLADGTPPPSKPAFDLGHGLLPAFGAGVKPQAGERVLVLSSGTARQPTDPGYQPVAGYDKGYTSGHPQGFPKESPACPGVTTGAAHDAAGLEVAIRVPTNAHGFSFNFDFFTDEWPVYVCSKFNDFFVALLSPIPMGQSDGDISFDSQGNPVSVNNAFLSVCGCAGGPPCKAGGKQYACSQGDSSLAGTGFKDGFQDHGATGWLFTKAPVTPGQIITLRWTVYDSGDGILDSTTVIDAWQWIAEPGTQVGTGVVDTPK